MFKRKRGWVKAQGRVVAVDRRQGTMGDGIPATWVDGYVVEIQPADGPPFRAAVDAAGFNHGLLHVESNKFRQPFEGETVGVEYDPGTKAVRFDLSDPALVKPTNHQHNVASHQQFEQALGGAVGSQPAGGAVGDLLGALGGGGDLRAKLVELAQQNPGGAVIDLRGAQGSGAGASAADPVDRLAKLASLKEAGLLSDAEFAAAKAKILGDG